MPQALKADLIVEGFGVNTHFAIPENNYDENQASVIAAMAELGVRYYRDFLFTTPDLQALAGTLYGKYGMRQSAVAATGTPADNWSSLQAYPRILSVAAVEGRNEPTLVDAPAAGTHISALRDLIRSNVAWNGTKIVAPSPIAQDAFSAMGDLSAKANRYNVHPYPGGYSPEHFLPDFTSGNYVPPASTGIFWATETGYHTKTDQSGFQGVPDYVAAQYLPRLLTVLLTHPTYAFEKVFFYEMLCSQMSGLPAYEQTFGLLNQDGSKRPQFTAMKALLNAMNDGGRTFTPSSVNVTLSGLNSTVIYRVFQKANGDFYILIWNNRGIWNPGPQTAALLADVSETVQLDVTPTLASVMRVNDAVPAWQPVSIDGSGKMAIPVGTGISILKISHS